MIFQIDSNLVSSENSDVYKDFLMPSVEKYSPAVMHGLFSKAVKKCQYTKDSNSLLETLENLCKDFLT